MSAACLLGLCRAFAVVGGPTVGLGKVVIDLGCNALVKASC